MSSMKRQGNGQAPRLHRQALLVGLMIAPFFHCSAQASNEALPKSETAVAASAKDTQQGNAGPDTIQVYFDQAKLLKLPAGAETLVIGNPGIADISIQKTGVIVITGRSPGRTNFIALDASGSIISESTISVTYPGGERLLVQRGLDRSHYDCAPNCLPTLTLGDENGHFGMVGDQMTRREGLSGQMTNKR